MSAIEYERCKHGNYNCFPCEYEARKKLEDKINSILTCPECGEYTDEKSLSQWHECRACAMQFERDQLRLAASEADALRSTVAAQARQIEAARDDGAEWMRQNVMKVLRERADEFYKEYDHKHYVADLAASCCVSAMRDIVSFLPSWLAANAPEPEPSLCDVCRERESSVERDGHKFCGYCYGSYAALEHGEEFAQPPAQEAKK